MKPLHLIAGKDDLRPGMQNLFVKQGHVYVTNGYAIIKMPVKHVFGDIEFSEDEVLLFDAKQWAAAKMHTAKSITRDGLMFKNITANTFIEATTPLLSGIHPLDYESVFIPKDWKSFPIPHIGVNPALLANVAAALGLKKESELQDCVLQFYGATKGIEILHPDFADCYIIAMPTTGPDVCSDLLKEATPVTLAEGEAVEPVAAPAVAKTNTTIAVTSGDFAAVRASLLQTTRFMADRVDAILEDHLSNTPELRKELVECFDVIRDEVSWAEVRMTADELVEALMKHKDKDAEHLLDAVSNEFGEIAIHDFLQSRGYAIIKCDTQDQQTALRDFVQTSIYPLVSDSDKYSI